MKQKRSRIIVCVAVAVGLLLVSNIPLADAGKSDVITWKGQSCFASTSAPYGPFGPKQTGVMGGALMWTEWLKKASGGRLLIDWAEPGAIVPNSEVDTAVGKNVVQISYAYGAYYAGRIPETDVETGGVFLWEDLDQVFECMTKYGFYEAMQKIYAKHNIKYVPFPTNAIQGIGTGFPAPDPASFKGKKIRAIGMWGDYIKMLGGSPVHIPWGEIYMAVKLGTIDGWCGGAPALESLKLKEVTKGYVNPPQMSVANANILINMDAFNALPADLQGLLQRDAMYASFAYSSNWHNQCNWVLKNAKKEYGVTTYSWSSKDIDRLTRLAVEKIFPRIAKKSKGCAELLEIVKKQMRDYGRID